MFVPSLPPKCCILPVLLSCFSLGSGATLGGPQNASCCSSSICLWIRYTAWTQPKICHGTWWRVYCTTVVSVCSRCTNGYGAMVSLYCTCSFCMCFAFPDIIMYACVYATNLATNSAGLWSKQHGDNLQHMIYFMLCSLSCVSRNWQNGQDEVGIITVQCAVGAIEGGSCKMIVCITLHLKQHALSVW